MMPLISAMAKNEVREGDCYKVKEAFRYPSGYTVAYAEVGDTWEVRYLSTVIIDNEYSDTTVHFTVNGKDEETLRLLFFNSILSNDKLVKLKK